MKITASSDAPPIDPLALGKMLGNYAALLQIIFVKFRQKYSRYELTYSKRRS